MAPIWHAFASSSYLHPVPDISVYSDATNDVVSRTPDFSEFKDPWEEYDSAQNDSLPSDNSGKNENYYYEAGYEREIASVDRRNDMSQHNQQFHYEQHSSYAPAQTQYSSHPNNEHNQHLEHVTSHFEENHNQRQFVQPTEHHWQQYSSDQKHQPGEQRHHSEQHRHNEQHQQHQQHHHEQRHNEPRHHNEQGQHKEHHQHSGQSQQHDYKTDDRYIQHQPHSNETWRENHAQQTSDQPARADHRNHTVSHNDFHPQHHIQNSAHDNFTSRCRGSNEKSSEQSETTNKQTDTRRIDHLHPSSPAPCTDLHNVAMRTDPNITEHLDNANVSNCSRIFLF